MNSKPNHSGNIRRQFFKKISLLDIGKIIICLITPIFVIFFLIHTAQANSEIPALVNHNSSQSTYLQTNPVSDTFQLDQHVLYMPYVVSENNTPVPPPPSCNIVLNSGFEEGVLENADNWIQEGPISPVRTSALATNGTFSMRTGIPSGNTNIGGYSQFYQDVTIPIDGEEAILSYWVYTQSSESLPDNLPDPPQMGADIYGPASPEYDTQFGYLMSTSGTTLERLFWWTASNNDFWNLIQFDVSAYRGKTIRVLFGTYNNGSGGVTAMWVDAVYLNVCVPPPPPPSSLADGWYLMVDDGYIEYHNVQRIYHPFQKHPNNPIMRADQPWEGRIIQLYGTVLPGFRMWYTIVNADWGIRQIAYAESQDGLNWYKPDLNGQGSNVLLESGSANLISAIQTPPDVYIPFRFMVNQFNAFQGYWSEDGIHLNPYNENPLFDNGNDVANFYWDSHTGWFGGTAKEYRYVEGIYRRVVRFINSYDFIKWNTLPELLVPDFRDDQIYEAFYPNFYGFPVFPSGNQYLGLLWILKASDVDGYYGQTTIQIASSHDGIHWIREEDNRPPILDVGPPGSWDGGQIYTATQPIKVEDELWLYYSGCNLEHGVDPGLVNTVCHIGLATAPYNRLVSLYGTGSILTESLSPSGSNLHINYDANEGSIAVELLRDGQTIPGYEAENCNPLIENDLDQIVAWSGQSYLPNGPFQIMFHIQNSSLYAFAIQ